MPGREHQRLRRREHGRLGVAHGVIGHSIGHDHGQSVRFLSGGAAGAPDSQIVVAPLLFALQELVEHIALKKVQLRLVAEKAGLIDGQVLDQFRQLLFPRLTDEEAIITVEGIQATLFETALQPVLEKGGAALV